MREAEGGKEEAKARGLSPMKQEGRSRGKKQEGVVMMKGMKAGRVISFVLLLIAFFALPVLAAGEMSAVETELARLINDERAARKQSPLSVHPALSAAARRHAGDMAKRDILSHEGSAGDSVRDRIERVGYAWKAYGEIIGMEHRCDPREMVALWLKSPRHAAIMLSAEYKEFGAGGTRQSGVYGSCYWTVVFGDQTRSKKGAR